MNTQGKTTKELQVMMDKQVELRTFWRLMLAGLTEPTTKGILEGLHTRLKGKCDEYVSRYDMARPDDAVGIAKCQEGRLICKVLLNELDADNCRRVLNDLDEKIKTLSDDIRIAAEKEARRNS